jgi:hypothetical protein
MENFTLEELNTMATNASMTFAVTACNFHQINASDEACYNITTDNDLIGLVYITDTGKEGSAFRYRASFDSLQTQAHLDAAEAARPNLDDGDPSHGSGVGNTQSGMTQAPGLTSATGN